MKFLTMLLCFSFAAVAQARTQVVHCLGLYQEGTLTIAGSNVSVEINDEGLQKTATGLAPAIDARSGTITYSNSAGMEVTIPQAWVGKKFARRHKLDAKLGYQIIEQTKFDTIVVSECESYFTP